MNTKTTIYITRGKNGGLWYITDDNGAHCATVFDLYYKTKKLAYVAAQEYKKKHENIRIDYRTV